MQLCLLPAAASNAGDDVTGAHTASCHGHSWGKTKEEMKDKFSLNSFYLLGSDKRTYYYTHLERIAVQPGQSVKAGDIVGYVGAYNGKNAHLHLALSDGFACDVLVKCTPADTRTCK